MWLLYHGGLADSAECYNYGAGFEDLTHLFRSCPDAKKIWESYCHNSTKSAGFSVDWEQWISSNLAEKKTVFGLGPSNIIFIWTLWFIWKWQCAKIFDDRFCMPFDVRKHIFRNVKEWIDSCKGKDVKNNITIELISWQPPTNEWVKINIDGSKKGKAGEIAKGGGGGGR
ncbi:hypothetical protein ACOSQ2_027256 [Xanthoceras sorbifolium]